MISIDEAAQAVPCSSDILRQWLRQGHIEGCDSFGRQNRSITDDSTGIQISVESLRAYCATMGVKPSLK